MSKVSSEVICDAGPVIHLDELDALDLLSDFAAVYLPEAVWDEIAAHRPQALGHAQTNLSRVRVELTDDPVLWAFIRAFSLDKGEQEAIQLARNFSARILLTDDAAARLAAEQLGLKVHGTVGILIRAARRQQRRPDQVLALLQALPLKSSLYLRRQFLDEIIRDFRAVHGL